MNTGLFELLLAVSDKSLIASYLDNSSFDELVELDTESRRFRSLAHVPQKYAMSLAEGTIGELLTNTLDFLIHPDDRERFSALTDNDMFLKLLDKSELPGLLCVPFRLRLITGDWRWTELVPVDVERFGGRKNIIRLYVFDIHNKKTRELSQSTENIAPEDLRNEVTGLLHRRGFTNRAAKLIANRSVNWCVAALDIENFRLYNEWYGHDAGDLLMEQIGVRLRRISRRAGGTAGYLGQDDFCMVIPYDKAKIEGLYTEITALINAKGKDISFLPAIGVCMADDDSSVRELLDRAFIAVQSAKQDYHRRICVFDKALHLRDEEEYHILSDFMQAMKRREIVFYLQPQCRASTGKIVGAEALARWVKPDGSVVSPNVFIPVLEKHNMITDLDFYIWDAVCRWQREWIDKGFTPLPISVNVSAMDILNTNVADTFRKLVRHYQLSETLIKIEITESTYVENAGLVKSTVQDLQKQGFMVLMDDFGSGYSTLNLLKDINVDVLKLDAQFLRMNESNATKSIQILESVSAMAKTLRIPIIVEGVETAQQKEFLKDIGCRYIQGYYFYRPMSTDSYSLLIKKADNIDLSGITFKSNQQLHLRELLDESIYSDNMLNSILGPSAFYARRGNSVDIIRFNEQFYEAVDVPDFHDRLDRIERFMPPYDHAMLVKLLKDADVDRLNGSKGLVHFYKTDGTLTNFFMRFFFLRADEDTYYYYGAVQNITRLVTLERQMALVTGATPDTILFLRRKPNGTIRFTVPANNLEARFGISRIELEKSLNSEGFFDKLASKNQYAAYREMVEKLRRPEAFAAKLDITTTYGAVLPLIVYSDYVIEDDGIIDSIIILRSAETQDKA